MERLRCVDADDMNYNQEVNYCLSETEWQLLLNLYKKNQSKMSPLMRNNLSKLVCALAASKTITTIHQANLIIALLLCESDTQESNEKESSPSRKQKSTKKTHNAAKQTEEINEMIEWLRLLIMRYQSRDCFPTRLHSPTHDRR